MSAADRRDQLVAVGLRLLETQPIHDLALDEVAEQAGISRSLLFHYFPSKAEFYVEVVRSAAQRVLRPVDLPADADPADRVRVLVENFVRFADGHRASYQALVRGVGGGDARVREVLEDTWAQLADRWLAAAGVTEPTAFQTLAARGWLAGMEETVLGWTPQTSSKKALVDYLVRSFDAALAAAS